MNFQIMDVVILLCLLSGAVVGFKRGLIKSFVMLIGAIIVIYLSYILKNPVSKFLYNVCPFFQFGGDFEGVTSLNLLLYEGIAFFIIYMILMCILQVLIGISGIIEKFLKFTIILAIPSKLLGAVFGLIESYIFVFIALFLLANVPGTNELFIGSKLTPIITKSTPQLSSMMEDSYKAIDEIRNVITKVEPDKDKYNRETLNILLKYKVVDKKTVEDLINSGKLEVKEANKVLENY